MPMRVSQCFKSLTSCTFDNRNNTIHSPRETEIDLPTLTPLCFLTYPCRLEHADHHRINSIAHSRKEFELITQDQKQQVKRPCR